MILLFYFLAAEFKKLNNILILRKKVFDNKKLRIELNKIKIKKLEINDEVTKFLNELEDKYIDYKNKCRDLEKEILLLNIKLNKTEPPPLEIKEKDPDLEKNCKELFRNISKKIHPDVVKEDDQELIIYFSLAKEAYDNLDFLELKRIKDLIDNKNNNILLKFINKNENELETEFNLLNIEINKEKDNINKLLNSIQYKIVTLLKTNNDIDNMIANKLFTDLFLSKVIELNNLKNKLEKECQVLEN